MNTFVEGADGERHIADNVNRHAIKHAQNAEERQIEHELEEI